MDKTGIRIKYLGVPLLAVMMGVGMAHAQSLAKADEKALKDMALANMAEVEAGNLALQKSQNTEVRAFAQQMVDDHSRGLDEVKAVAQAKGVMLPTELDAKHQALNSKLAAQSGDRFDRAYVEHAGVKGHREAKAIVAKAQTAGKDPDVKAVAAKLQPTIDQHIGHVQQLSASIKGTTASGASGAGSTGGSEMRRATMPKSKDKISTQQESSGNTDHPDNPANPATNPAPVR